VTFFPLLSQLGHYVRAPLLVVLLGCGGDAYLNEGRRARGDHETASTPLPQIKKNPGDLAGRRELGIACFRRRELGQAAAVFEEIRRLAPNDALAAFYLGLTYEQQERWASAISVYQAYSALTRTEAMRRQLGVRINRLKMQAAEQEMQRAAGDGVDGPGSANTVAVLYFRNVNERDELAPLLKGLAALLASDFSKVRNLQVLERIKLEALLNGAGLTPALLYDDLTAPRAGRLLGARYVIVGGIVTLGEVDIQIDAGVWETTRGEMLGPGTHASGRLSEILRLEKSLVLALLEQLRIRLNVTEREAIQKNIPRSNLAFLAYCRGLDFADRLDYERAAAAFQEALRLDADFQEARTELAKVAVTPLGDEELERLAQRDR